jgi:hypothetical protein
MQSPSVAVLGARVPLQFLFYCLRIETQVVGLRLFSFGFPFPVLNRIEMVDLLGVYLFSSCFGTI